MEDEKDDGSYRVMPLVRMVYGKTKTEIRDRLMLAFNSPLFPEILVSSSVMGEGVAPRGDISLRNHASISIGRLTSRCQRRSSSAPSVGSALRNFARRGL